MIASITAALLLSLPLSNALVVPKASRFKFFEMPEGFSGPCDLAPGPDGAIWIQDILAPYIARIDTDTDKVTSYKIPYTHNALPTSGLPTAHGKTPLACAIQPGSDGNMYAASGIRDQFVKINIPSHKIDVFTPPTAFLGNLQPFNDLYRAPTGMYLTQSSANLVSHFDYKTHKFKSWTIPTPLSFPLGLKVSNDGAVWFAEFVTNKMGRLNATTGEFKEFPVGLGLSQPAVIRAEEYGKLYFTAAVGNAIGSIETSPPYNIERFPAAEPLRVPGTDILDGQGRVWFSSFSSTTLGRLNPKTGKTVAIKTPNRGKGVNIPILAISVTYGKPNSIYFTETTSNQVGRLKL